MEPSGVTVQRQTGLKSFPLECVMGNERAKKRGVDGDPKTVPDGLADGLSKCWPAEKADEALGYLRRIAEALETMNESAARQSQEWLDPDDVAAEMKVSRDTACRIIDSGEMRSKRIVTPKSNGSRALVRVSRKWFNDYMNDVETTRAGHDSKSKPRRRRRRDADSNGETDYFS
ncbi:MAG: hypothetical protein IID42_12955 [Planctomycetes bacterium]|nr:hypothetical protein [Planctomycetota bacterium]